ncbi:hypothetical protein CPB83DRAFT_853747 [Crepidotus variabilis]|uniref:Uncharacterized protein n=1 Tax=Crepidotus variabilis TaxID=179855 RepID=A0A9P6EH56_9AGAR|nr:hypothetical protein CPB83DRAFT_853747 [Crepidotus variabilis]
MPTEVQRPPAEVFHGSPRSAQQHQALKLALGTILTPKRPYIASNSRPTSGTASPAFFGSHSASGAHTPAGTPPVPSGSASYPPAQGPISSENLHLHPHHAYGHHSHGHGAHPPSRLGPGRSSSYSGSPSESSSTHHSAPSTAHTSPFPGPDHSLNDIEPLSMPPAALGPHHPKLHQTHHHDDMPHAHSHHGADPPPPTPSSPTNDSDSISHASAVKDSGIEVESSPTLPHHPEVAISVFPPSHPPSNPNTPPNTQTPSNQSGRGTPRTKFLEALQSKSAWDALIHGSFT